MPSTVHAEQRTALGTALGIAGQTCVITGATSGIGEEVAFGLARLGMSIVAVGRTGERLDGVARAADAEALPITTFRGDVAAEADMQAAMAHARATFGRLDAVFANAGIAAVGPAMDVSASAFTDVVMTNLVGAFLTARAAAAAFDGPGSIVFTTSSFARRGAPGWSSYNASKAGLAMLTETLAAEWAPARIRVNAVGPTATLTNVNRALFEEEGFRASVIAGIPVGRLMETGELVLPVAFLLSPLNEMLTGQTLYVDGGQTL